MDKFARIVTSLLLIIILVQWGTSSVVGGESTNDGGKQQQQQLANDHRVTNETRILQPVLPAADLYVPGLQTVKENGLILSNGLKSRVVAQALTRVKLANGRRSRDRFHTLPDGAACFIDPNSTDPMKPNYKYVVNSEDPIRGGVGAIEFDWDGNILGYEMISRNTRWNCGGGRTFYNTWITCEERDGGQIHEIIPYPTTDFQRDNRYRKTALGMGSFGYYESVAIDYRNPKLPRVYITTDRDYGPLIRYTPSNAAADYAATTKDYTSLWYVDTDDVIQSVASYRPAKYEYMILDVVNKLFYWTTNITASRVNAEKYYRSCEGIDIRSNFMYVTCKREKFLFVFDLDKRSYSRSSTENGAFDGQPDQIAHVLDGPGTIRDEDDVNEILYFAEDVDTLSRYRSGIHGRNRDGKYFPIVQSERWPGESSGLAFSPGNYKMYLSIQKPGRVFEISRIDGKPFHGQRLDIQYHDGDVEEEERL